MDQQSLNKLMQDSAKDAVSSTAAEFKLALDGTPASIEIVDLAIHGFISKYHDGVLDNKIIFTVCNMYGAYIGEIYKSLVGGNWHYDNSNPDEPAIFLMINERSYAFAGICYQRLVVDQNISVNEYFKQAVAGATQ